MKHRSLCVAALALACSPVLRARQAAPVSARLFGTVRYQGEAVPGASIRARQGATTRAAVTGEDGRYEILGLEPGAALIRVVMTGFAMQQRAVTLAAGATAEDWELVMLPAPAANSAAGGLVGRAPPGRSSQPATAAPPAVSPSLAPGAPELAGANPTAAPALAINGSVQNGAASPYFQLPAFGNDRRGQHSLYNGAVGGIFGLSALDARPFSLTGQPSPKPAYAHITGLAQIGGPLLFPGVFTVANAPMVFAAYQMTRSRSDTIGAGLVPTVAERSGDLSQFPQPIVNPQTGQPFPGNRLPGINLQAAALLQLYPLPNASGGRFNYQTAIVAITHEDDLQTRVMKRINDGNQLAGDFALKSSRASSPNLFGFLDTTDTLGLNASLRWRHDFSSRLRGTLSFPFSRLRIRQAPFFAGREDISGAAGIAGNDPAPAAWGPPALSFAGGLAGLNDMLPADNRDQTAAISYAGLWNHGDHDFAFGGDVRRLEFNRREQQNPRGQLVFNGAASGNDLADFLLGIPDAASLAFGNADKYFRESSYDAYFVDDGHLGPGLSLNLGLRWEYAAPITERQDRLVNLDLAPGFTAAAPVLAAQPRGPLTGAVYPRSLVRPDRRAFEPRLGLAWQPFAASSLLVRAGYGVYYNTSVYQALAAQMAQQAPLSTSFSAAYNPARPWTLADVFSSLAPASQDLFALDPNFRRGYVQTWDASLQQDLPAALTMTLTYLGSEGVHAPQEILPNTYPAGAANPCPSCPIGFFYISSGGNAAYESGRVELQRRFAGGLAGDLQYTYSKALDDGALGGGQPAAFIAQNWRAADADRALSNTDQRHRLTATAQYTTGLGPRGGALLGGWRGLLYKAWTLQAQLTAGSGLPLTPVTFAIVPGTGVTQVVRPSLTGAPLYAAPAGLFLNPAAYAPPPPGAWGDAGRNSITGPSQFNLDMALQRSFFLRDRLSCNFRLEADNVLNHVVFPSWDTVAGSAQFGLPLAANPMRSIKTYLRLVF